MAAGTALGIDVRDEVTLYDMPEPSPTSSPLGIFVVREAHPSRSTITPLFDPSSFELHKPAFALKTKAGSVHYLPVHIAEQSELGHVFEELVRNMHHVRPDGPGILLVEKEKAMLAIVLDHKKIMFDIRVLDERVLDEFVAAFGNWQRIPFSSELDLSKLHPILDTAAHFHWHLSRTNKHHILQNKIRFEFTEVEEVEGEYEDDLNVMMKPIRDNLNQNGIINLVSGVQQYGIKIINHSAATLYGALFYFNMNDLSIGTCLLCAPGGMYY
jgi:hypothetical protein